MVTLFFIIYIISTILSAAFFGSLGLNNGFGATRSGTKITAKMFLGILVLVFCPIVNTLAIALILMIAYSMRP